MRWEPDVARGAWIAERVTERSGDLHIAVPSGFEAYARIFHPIEADRPVGASWDEIARSGQYWPGEFERRTASWAEVAVESGATVHPTMQWHAITPGRLEPMDRLGLVGATRWRFGDPMPGNPGPGVVATLARVLAEHTSTPRAGVAAMWDGWGGLFGEGRVPRLSLPWRDHVLFDAGVEEFAAPDWPERAPWVENAGWPECPSLMWPDDRAWVVVSEIDWDSTIVAGTRVAIDAVLAASGIEVLEVPQGADLSSAGDAING